MAFLTLFFWGFLIIPTLLGVAFELYVLHPLGGVSSTVPVYLVLNEWSFGMLLVKILCTAVLAGPDTPIKRELNLILTRGLNFELLSFHRHVIFPVMSVLLMVILIPQSFANVFNDLETAGNNKVLTL